MDEEGDINDSDTDQYGFDENEEEDDQDENDMLEVFHVQPHHEFVDPDSEGNNLEEINNEYINLANYDIGLPLEHTYLGQLNTQNGRLLFPEGAKLRLPLVYLNGIILIPGQEIPFTFRHQPFIDFFRRIVENDSKTFGVGYESNYGTTAEIRSCNFDNDKVTLRAEGRQRFVITNKSLDMYEIFQANIIILPEIELKGFFHPIKKIENYPVNCSTKKLAALTHLPDFVHRQFDDLNLMKKLHVVLKKILESKIKQDLFTYPDDPSGLSYFVISCIPFSDRMKARLLQFNCTISRLRMEYYLLSNPFEVLCAHCGSKLCTNEDFLVMSKVGTGGTFVNPSGVVHELFTFSNVSNAANASDWSDEFSWFPEYGWIIIRCEICLLHLGWKFVTKKNIKPKKFWAITRTGIKLSFRTIDKDSFAHNFVQDCQDLNSIWNA